MSEAAAAQPPPERPRTLEEWFIAQDAKLEQLRALLEHNLVLLGRKGPASTLEDAIALTENADRIADVQGELRDLRAWGKSAMAWQSLGQASKMLDARLTPAEPDPRPRRKGGHRRRDPADRARMRLAAFSPAAAWATQHVIGLSAAGAATAATVTIGTALTLTAPAGHAASQVRHDLSGPVASAPQWTAVPLAPAAPSPSRARQDAKTAAPAPYPAASEPAVTPSPPPASPSPSQAPGVLVADTSTLDLGLLGAASVTITAEGGPVQWAASPVAGLEAWPSSGMLQDGESVTVKFRATDQTHSGFGIVDLGGADVSVSWPAVAGLVQGIASSL